MQKDYLKYIASDNEIVGGNESNMNYLMTIKKEEDGWTINEYDNGYYEESTLYTKTLSLLLPF